MLLKTIFYKGVFNHFHVVTKKRNRSRKLKDLKFHEIIRIGKSDLLTKEYSKKEHRSPSIHAQNITITGFNMEDIAKRCNMTRGNLYRYIESKRELWFAILQDYVRLYNIQVEEIHSTSNITNLEKLNILFNHYINFSSEDSHLMQKMIFLNPPPPKIINGIPEIGPIEKSYLKLGDVFPNIRKIIDGAINNEDLIPMNPDFFMQYLWGTLQGSILMIEDFQKSKASDKEKRRFQTYITEQIRFKLNSYTPKYQDAIAILVE
jgi:AcrR family transcriptional regulator